MCLSPLFLAICALPLQASDTAGTLGGIVVKAADPTPVSGAEVVLREYVDGQFLPAAKTTSDADGRYYFRNLPVDGRLYQPGANHGGVHYPGEKVRLTARRPVAGVKLEVCDPVTGPSPLVVRSHDIVIEPLPGRLQVREVLEIENSGSDCYVGASVDGGGEPVTLGLSIPGRFERMTFDKEFFGRRFSVRGEKVVTGIPWTPGRRELAFTYVLPNEDRFCVWERNLDLPSSQIRLAIHADDPDAVSCNLGARSIGEHGDVVYLADGPLPAGHVLRVELGRLPISAMAYARWTALALLGGAIVIAAVVLRRKRADSSLQPAAPEAGWRRGRRESRRSAGNTMSATRRP